MKKQKTFLLFLIPLAIPLIINVMMREKPCSEHIDTSMGVQASYPVGWQESLQQLSRELKRCPQAKRFIIRRKTSWLKGYELRTEYDRNTHVLFDSRFVEGSPYRWLNVREEVIYAIAASGGSFDDFKKYGCIDGAA